MLKIKTAVYTLILSLAVIGAGCDDKSEVTTNRTVATNVNTVNVNTVQTPVSGETTLKVADITGNPTRYAGQTVTVRSDVEAAYGANVFRLDDDSVLEGGIDNDLLVIAPPKANLISVDKDWFDKEAMVTGTVRNFVVAEIEREYGIDLDTEIEAEFKNKPVLIATSVRRGSE